MIRLSDFILEKKQKSRKEELINYLKGKNYPNYIETLEDMLKDPKTRALIEDGFGGELGNTQLKFSEKIIPVKKLLPTQQEIGMTQSLDYGLKGINDTKIYFQDAPIEIKHPLITFNGVYVIDGHHRWSEILCFNPEAEMVCINYDGDMSPIQMLKVTQGAIAASLGKLVHLKSNGINLYDSKITAIRKYIKNTIKDTVIDNFIKYNPNLNDKNDVINYITDNVLDLINDYPPIKYAPERDDMPQTSRAGEHTDKESALGRMKNDKVLKVK